jgi:peptide deformylase
MAVLPIITIPHPTLRQTAERVKLVTPELISFTNSLAETLDKKRNPGGVGLAAPQLNKLWRIFVLNLDLLGSEKSNKRTLQVCINPEILAHSQNRSLGPNPKDATLEGCLSMPGLYGPVPRWQWIDLTFSELVNGKLETRQLRLNDFAARVAQHEYDHLEGILFTDYANEYDLPVYKENKKGELIELEDRSLLNYL